MKKFTNSGQFKVGLAPHNKGKTLSLEQIEKLRQAKLGKKASDETKKKMSEAHKGNKSRTGQKQSIEEKLKKSNSLKGRKKTPEHVKKIAEAQRGVKRPQFSRENHPMWKGGRTKVDLAGRPKPEICEVCGGGGVICFDHDHKTGKFRGWICNHCNITLGFSRDNTEVLRKLIKYLETAQP